VLGMALAQRWRPRLRLAVSLSGTPQPKLLESTGAKFETWPYAEADEWDRRLRDDVSVVCQASLSESFNYVAADAIGWGRPVVGSPAIRYLPPAWTVDPNNPRQVAAMILEHLDDYEARAQQARRIAVALAARQNAAYCAMIGRLCGE
jgi:glycosyltransferase involved in cell wall biosynthesis